VLADNDQWCNPPLKKEEVIDIAQRYTHQTKAQEYTGSIFTQHQPSANEDGIDGQFEDARGTGVFSLQDGDLLLPAKARHRRVIMFSLTWLLEARRSWLVAWVVPRRLR
jgi:hypothetical protein